MGCRSRRTPGSAGLRIVAMGVAVAVLTSCTGAPDRESEAKELDRSLEALPGVESSSVSYSNTYTQGTRIAVDVRLAAASVEQIEAVASRIAAGFRQDFGGFGQSATFRFDGGTVEHRSDSVDRPLDLAPAQVVADARAVRQVASAVQPSAGKPEITLGRTASGSELDLRGVADDVGLAAVRAAVGESPAFVQIFPESRAATFWTVRFPFRADDEAKVRETLARLVLRAPVVTVVDGRIAALRVVSPSAADAYPQLVSVIGAVAHPMMLTWDEGAAPGASDQRRFRGSVHVGGCSYPDNTDGEMRPEKYGTDAALAMQKRLRDAYDTCPR